LIATHAIDIPARNATSRDALPGSAAINGRGALAVGRRTMLIEDQLLPKFRFIRFNETFLAVRMQSTGRGAIVEPYDLLTRKRNESNATDRDAV
jgi:hypothetical protein